VKLLERNWEDFRGRKVWVALRVSRDVSTSIGMFRMRRKSTECKEKKRVKDSLFALGGKLKRKKKEGPPLR